MEKGGACQSLNVQNSTSKMPAKKAKRARLAEAPPNGAVQDDFAAALQEAGVEGGLRLLFDIIKRLEVKVDTLSKAQKSSSPQGPAESRDAPDEVVAEACRAACRSSLGEVVTATAVQVQEQPKLSMADFCEVSESLACAYRT